MNKHLATAVVLLVALATSYGAWGAEGGDSNEESFTLGIYGNANMDGTIDEMDIAYVEGVINSTNAATNLSDANYDGKVDSGDLDQIRQIIRGDEGELTLIDDSVTSEYPEGKPVTIRMPANRIIALHADSAEVLMLLQSKDKIIGIADTTANSTKSLPGICELPTVGSSSDPDAEMIIQMKPDIVLAYGHDLSKWTTDLEKKLNGSDIALVRLSCYQPETMSSDVIKLGYIVNNVARATEYVDWYEGYLSILNEKIATLKEDDKPKVYVERSKYMTYSKGSAAHNICQMAGGSNIATDLDGMYPQVDPEWVITQNPDIILKTATSNTIKGGYEDDDPAEMKAAWEEIMNRSELANVKAVKDNKVYLIHTAGVWNNPEYFIGIIYLGKWFHPGLFEDLDPMTIHQEFVSRFLGLDYDLSKHGVFVYPPLQKN